jgi:hypothetical protein
MGGKFVLASKDHVYHLDDQELPRGFVGKKVKPRGILPGCVGGQRTSGSADKSEAPPQFQEEVAEMGEQCALHSHSLALAANVRKSN